MSPRTRLEKLERAAAARAAIVAEREKPIAQKLFEILPLPEYVPEDFWKRALELLADDLPDSIHPWKSLDDFIACCQEHPAHRIVDLYDPLLHALKRAAIEIGRKVEIPDSAFPELVERRRERLSRNAETTGQIDTGSEDANRDAETNPS